MRVLIAMVLCLPVVAFAQAPPPATERWQITISTTTDESASTSKDEPRYKETYKDSLHSEAHVTAVVEAFASTGGYQSLRVVSLSASGSSRTTHEEHIKRLDVDSEHHNETDDWTEESSATAEPPATKDGVVAFTVNPAGVAASAAVRFRGASTNKRTHTDYRGTTHKDDSTPIDEVDSLGFYGPATAEMVSSRHYTGSETDTGNPTANAKLGQTQVTVTTVDIQPLTPRPDAELVLSIPHYEDWLPDPKSPLVVTATLKGKKGKLPADLHLSKLHAKLVGTSSEPGESVNWPLHPTKTEKDLVVKGGNARDAAQQEIEIPFAHDTEQVEVDATDYGGWSELVITGDLTDGRTLTAVLPGKPNVLLPYRDAKSHVATAWKKANKAASLADDDDSETKPAGKPGAPGDGLTLYEEYRGMQCGDAHVRLDPANKDLFVHNRIGAPADAGLKLLQTASGIAVHGCLAKDQLLDSRVVNANHGDGPHLVDQHAIVLKYPDAETDDSPRKRSGAYGGGGASERIGTPGQVKYVTVDEHDAHVKALGELDWDIEVAHELMHAMGVEHHGEEDVQPAYWEYTPAGDLIERATTAATITVQDELGHVLPRTDHWMQQLWVQHPDEPMSMGLYVAHVHGEHSGDEHCIMRYAVSQPVSMPDGTMDFLTIFVDEKNPNVRHLVPKREPLGTHLCTSKTGTGNNAPGHRPTRWHGDATRGDCAHQFVVSDRFPIAEHAAQSH
ncbi:MAG: hypothetical protein JO257_25615 [Deltaproteobacteria bacterium]|nr:hypothetical protein [Deltaproteobacteria bacterium]